MQNSIEAVTAPDPYPYYAELVASKPLYRDEETGLWIASSAATVTAVLASELCRVRPVSELVPVALLGSGAGDIFRHLVRMNDGQVWRPVKHAVSQTLQHINRENLAEESSRWALFLADQLQPASHFASITDFALQLPVYTIASLLGIPQEHLSRAAEWVGQFVACIAPNSSPQQIERGKVAADNLLQLMREMLHFQQGKSANVLLYSLAQKAEQDDITDPNIILANGIGLLTQAYEATAGLIGNTLVILGRHVHIYEQVIRSPESLYAVIQEVSRYDPSVQNTRRFLSEGGVIAGKEMRTGDAVLVVLAAANRDPEANADPHRFDSARKDRCSFTFGSGKHACPGEVIAITIAQAGVMQLIQSGIDLPQLVEHIQYRTSVNTRIPVFEGGKS